MISLPAPLRPRARQGIRGAPRDRKARGRRGEAGSTSALPGSCADAVQRAGRARTAPGGGQAATLRALGKAAPPGLPPASLSLLVAGIAAQVQVGLGLQKNPLSNTMTKSLDAAKHGIELLEILEAKTKGNLDARESALLGAVLYDLRMAYVEARRPGP